MSGFKTLGSVVAAGIVAGLSATTPAIAADYFAGKTITSMQVFGSGGLYGLYNRLMAHYLEKHIPGHPTIIVEEMKGGGGLKGANYLYNVAPKNGTYMGLLNKDLAVFQILRPKSVKYNVAKFEWIGRAATFATVTYVTSHSPATTIEEAKHKVDILAATGKAAASYLQPTLLNALIGTKFKIVTGYRGGSAMSLSAERGETNGWGGAGAMGFLSGDKGDQLKSGKIVLLYQTGSKPYPQFGKHVPLMRNLTKDPESRKLINLINSGADIGMALTAPPGVPHKVLATLRSSFNEAMKDPGLADELHKRSLLLEPATGEELHNIAVESIDVSPALKARARKIFGF